MGRNQQNPSAKFICVHPASVWAKVLNEKSKGIVSDLAVSNNFVILSPGFHNEWGNISENGCLASRFSITMKKAIVGIYFSKEPILCAYQSAAFHIYFLAAEILSKLLSHFFSEHAKNQNSCFSFNRSGRSWKAFIWSWVREKHLFDLWPTGINNFADVIESSEKDFKKWDAEAGHSSTAR